jgi:hypothetical protein
VDDLPNRLGGHAEPSSEFSQRPFVGRIKFSNPLGLGERQATVSVFGTIGSALATLPNLVVTIILVGSEKEMIRPNAQTVVAGMANHKSISDFTIGQHPRCPMGRSVPAVDAEATIIAASPCCPPPTATTLADFLPKPLICRGVVPSGHNTKPRANTSVARNQGHRLTVPVTYNDINITSLADRARDEQIIQIDLAIAVKRSGFNAK